MAASHKKCSVLLSNMNERGVDSEVTKASFDHEMNNKCKVKESVHIKLK